MGVFAVVIAIGAGAAYYCYPSAINNALGINSAGVDTISDSDLLAADNSSLATIDPDAGTDGAAANAGVAAAPQAPAHATSPSSAKKSVAKTQSSVALTSTVEDDDSGDSAMAQTSSSPSASASSSTPAVLPAVPCIFPASAPVPSTTREIIFNEIAWMGSPSSSTAEWMEIKNISAAAVSLSGWELLDTLGKIKISFTDSDGTLAPGGLLLLSRGTTTLAGATGATKTYSGDLVNAGDTLALIDPQCDVSDYLDASGLWPAGNNTTKQTLERDADGIGWHTSAQPGGTPGAENSGGPAVATTTPSTAPAVQMPTSVSTQTPQNVAPIENTPEDTSASPDSNATTSTNITTSSSSIDVDVTNTQSTTTTSTDSGSNSDNGASNSNSADNNTSATNTAPAASAPSHILIVAVQIAGAASSNDLVKLYNPTAAAIDMSGWKLHKKSSTGADYSLKVFPTGSAIGAGQSFVWANSDNGFSEAVSANVSSTETLAADNSVALMDAAGNIVDAVAWGTGTNQYGEGPPYPTSPGANQLLSRRSSDGAMADTGDNSDDFTIQ